MAESAGDKDSRWYFTAEQLQNSPSRKCGIDADKELVYRQQTAYLIQEMGQALRVSQLCINTAIVYMHRFYAFHSFSHFNRHRIAAASLFLAAKVEEQPRKLEHVIRVAFTCLNIEAPDPSKETFAEQAQDLVFNENVLLQTLGFDVAIDHPHTHVVKTCHLVKANSSFAACKDLAQTSYFMASNSLHLTTMCLQYKPTVVACFCIHLACRWSSWDIPHSSEGLPWFHYVDKSVTKELLTQLTEEFIQIYDKSPSRLKNKLNSIKTLAQSAKTDEGQRSGSSQERSNHHRASTSMSHHGKQPVDPKGVASSSRQQHYQQMHHQSKSRERPVAPPPKTATQGSSGGHRTLPPPRDAFASKSRPGFPPHHPAGFPHKQPEYRQKEVSSGTSSSAQAKGGQYQQSSGYFGEPTRSHSGSQGMRYSQNSSHNKHGDPAFSHAKNSLHGMDESMGGGGAGQNSEGGGEGVSSPRLPQKSIFSPDQPEKMEAAVVKKAPPPAPRFDDRRSGEVKKDKRGGGEMPKTLAPEKKVASVKPMTKHPQLFGQPYKASSASAQGKRSFDEMTRHEESGIDFREAKMRRSEAENESRARGKMESTMNPLNLGGSFNAFDATFDQPKSHKFPPSLVNSIETNADLVSCLLKESLSENKYGSALNAGGMTEKQQQQQQQSEPVAPAEPQILPQGVTLAQPVKVEGVGGAEAEALHHKSKSEKKKKKEKHKHKEKDKSKDREERKKHKRDKTREGGGGAEEIPKNPVTLKITLPPREKAASAADGGAAALDGGFKIKIPKDRIRADLNPGHVPYEAPPGSLPSVDLMSDKPSSSLKIKISKDKIENFSDGASFGGAFAGGKKKDKDKEKLMRTTFQ